MGLSEILNMNNRNKIYKRKPTVSTKHFILSLEEKDVPLMHERKGTERGVETKGSEEVKEWGERVLRN